jgi:lipopolysaccharide transport system ATP-binding protein
MSDIAISVRQVSKKYRLFDSPRERLIEALHPLRKQYHREFWALRDVSFDVHRGEIVGIMGRNGSGKSTLLQIICSVIRPTLGEVLVNGRISALLELGAGFNPEFTGRDNVLLNGAIMGIPRKEMLRRLPEVEAFADIGDFFDQPVKTYSSGMYVRVAFAAAIHVDPEILVVDEALSVGDTKFQHRCFQRIRSFMDQGKTILVVSHSTDTLLRICHCGVVFDAGGVCHVGPISSAVNYYQDLLFGSPGKTTETSHPASNADTSGNSPLYVGSLSKDFCDTIFEKPCYNVHETRLGNGTARIIDFDLIVDGEVNPHEIRSHKDVELILKILFNESLSGVSVGFAIVSIDGSYIFGTNMAMMRKPLISSEAGRCLAVRFRWKSHLAGGEHFLNVGCSQFIEGEDNFVDVRRSVARLKFTDTPSTSGFVDLEVSHEIIELPGSNE